MSTKKTFRQLSVPRKGVVVISALMVLAAITAAVLDVVFTNRYYESFNDGFLFARYQHAIFIGLIGVLIAWVSLSTPRLVIATVLVVFWATTWNSMSGYSMTTPEHLMREGPRYPLGEFPWSLNRFISLMLLCWTFGVVFLTWGVPRLWRAVKERYTVNQNK